VNPLVPAEAPGRGILAFAWWSTAVFTVTATLAAVSPTVFLRIVAVIVALVAFAIGMIVFLVAYFRAIGRSRYEVISVVGVYLFVGGVAPAAVRRSLVVALAVQTVVALITASVRPYTSLAFGVLVPLLGVALCGLWSARHGHFPQRAATGAGEEVSDDDDEVVEDDDIAEEDKTAEEDAGE
jgi:hypothetical protein